MLVSQETIDELRELPRRRRREKISVLQMEIDRLCVLQRYVAALGEMSHKLPGEVYSETQKLGIAIFLMVEATSLGRQTAEKQDEINSLRERLENDCD